MLAHWDNSPRIDKSPHLDTLSWFWANQSLLFLLMPMTIHVWYFHFCHLFLLMPMTIHVWYFHFCHLFLLMPMTIHVWYFHFCHLFLLMPMKIHVWYFHFWHLFLDIRHIPSSSKQRKKSYLWWSWESWCKYYIYIQQMLPKHVQSGYPLHRNRVKVMVLNTTFNNISVISWRSDLLVEETRVPRENPRNWCT